MSEAYNRMKAGLDEAHAIARGDQPAARIWHQGHSYVPESELQEALRRYDERNRTAQDRAISNGLKLERIAALESELAGCKIALEQAWESSRERQADIEQFMRRLGPRWFLEQGWFPASIKTSEESDDDS